MTKVTEALRSAPVPGGVHVVHPDREQLSRLIADGYKFLVYGVDEIFLGHAASKEAAFAASLVP
jgi:hypothetical protein